MSTERERVTAQIKQIRTGLGRTVEILGARADVRTRLLGARPKPSGQAGDRLDEDKTIAELMRQATEQATLLVRAEVRLAQLEVGETANDARSAMALLAAAGVAALLGGGALTAMLVALLATALDAVWPAALIVASALLAIALVASRAGLRSLDLAHAAHRARAGWPGETPPA